MRNPRGIAIAAALAVLPGLAIAQSGATSTDRIDKRHERQQQRIDKGVQSGALTEKEAERLRRGQDRIQQAETKALADGTVTPKERARIEHMQDRQSKAIARQKHDKQHAK